ncbi:molecular chaperone GroEL [Yoonia sp. R2-816]|uniref:molecular chaperone GroEL n=1 Tax=Yoonia sp. R2-816 TaxID=3342638 RepID=UPI0037270BD4
MADSITIFFEAWGMSDHDARISAIQSAVDAKALYTDPRTEAPLSGPDAIAEYVGMFAKSAPGAVAEVADASERDGVTRATILFKMSDGMQQTGQYFVERGDDGLITRMVGFVGTGLPS